MILNLIPQLPASYKIALLKNEFGDVEIDSQLASSSGISGVKELLNGCICCNLVGQLGDALQTLRQDVSPDRVMIETSGSAFPATLAMEVNRLARETGDFVLDGVIVAIDVENWQGYDDTSYTAKMQARYTDLIVFNKWELVDERRYDDCLDRIGDLEIQVATVKSDKGKVDKDLLLGLDSALAKNNDQVLASKDHGGEHHDHVGNHQNEVEVLSVSLTCQEKGQVADQDKLHSLLSTASADEIYRIKAIVSLDEVPKSSDQATSTTDPSQDGPSTYILNWAFGRWNFTLADNLNTTPTDGSREIIVRMTIVLARYEATKWAQRVQEGSFITSRSSGTPSQLDVRRIL